MCGFRTSAEHCTSFGIITISCPKNEHQKYIRLHVCILNNSRYFLEEYCIKVVIDTQNYLSTKVVLFRFYLLQQNYVILPNLLS
jgi:hypothetical protein